MKPGTVSSWRDTRRPACCPRRSIVWVWPRLRALRRAWMRSRSRLALKARLRSSSSIARRCTFQSGFSAGVGDGYRAIGQRVDAAIPRIFAHRPHAPLDIRPTPSPPDQTDAAAKYDVGTPDGSRPGVFYYNTYDLPSRPTRNMETLYLHEAVPGHHFQLSLAQENEALPNCCASTATRRSRRAGRCTPKASARSSACSPTRTSASATTTKKSGARCGWWSTPACTRWAGRASRRSTTCSRTPR